MKAAAMIALAMSAATGTVAFQLPMVTRGVAPSRSAVSMSSPGSATGDGKGLQYNPDKYTDEKNKGNYRKLSEALEVSFLCLAGRFTGSVDEIAAVVQAEYVRGAQFKRGLLSCDMACGSQPPLLVLYWDPTYVRSRLCSNDPLDDPTSTLLRYPHLGKGFF